MSDRAVLHTALPNLVHRGKVRDIYDLGERLMLVASDRISAFDVVMNEPVPDKGVILTRLSQFWFERLAETSPHHLEYIVERDRVPPGYEAHSELLAGRAMVVRKSAVVPVECVVRGYIVGGGWREYQARGSVSGVTLPAGLRLADKLPEPIFTPSTKAASGHDEPISYEEACAVAGREVMERARGRALAIYNAGAAQAAERGIIIADSKFEFGLLDGELLLIDEVLTPDSSRFWRADEWRPGETPNSFDKQFLRDYLNGLADWDKQPPAPRIPAPILKQTRQRYLEAYEMLTGGALAL